VIEKESIHKLMHALQSGNFVLEQRVTLKMKSNPEIFEPGAFALNDFTIFKRDNSSMIKVHVTMNGEFFKHLLG
jgi:NAD+ kinase